MSSYLSVFEFFKKTASETFAQISNDGTINQEQNQDKKTNIKISDKPDEFIPNNNQNHQENSEQVKSSSLLDKFRDLGQVINIDKITDFGKKIYNNITEGANKIKDLALDYIKELPEKFKIAQEEHDERLKEINKQTEIAQDLSKSESKKTSDSVDDKKLRELTHIDQKEFNKYLKKLFYEKECEAKQELAQQEALRQEQARMQREAEAKRAEHERLLESQLIAQRKESESKETQKKEEIAKTPLIRFIQKKYSHLLNGFELTDATTEGQIIKFLLLSKKLRDDQKKELIVLAGSRLDLNKFSTNDRVKDTMKGRNSEISVSSILNFKPTKNSSVLA